MEISNLVSTTNNTPIANTPAASSLTVSEATKNGTLGAKYILVTGGCGFIGSHTTIELINSGYTPIILDNLSNSKPEVVERIKKITKKDVMFVKGDASNKKILTAIFEKFPITGVIHFAGYKAVGESCETPLKYYSNNLSTTTAILETMQKFGVQNLVFSSSATVYYAEAISPNGQVTGECIEGITPTVRPTNPYGTTKLIQEWILEDAARGIDFYPGITSEKARPLRAIALRYFNPIGAHKSGFIGEDPNGIPNNLVPYITQVAIGRLQQLTVNGADYPTVDGTAIRDYIHVLDLAIAHVKTLQYLENVDTGAMDSSPISPNAIRNNGTLFDYFNIGTGTGSTVMQVISAFMAATNGDIPYVVGPRRAGDSAVTYANTTKAQQYLNFKATYGLAEMAVDSWNWQKLNPLGIE
ncbi:MAG: UDP-glucose 4-epimerase GalE [Bifidobacteriaceae bacterium]|jgi:UDP-glucose 4-epimerase|nr:UDP-glucose 4-epimerase GalE [Bifidobacteriaceae bacterium]